MNEGLAAISGTQQGVLEGLLFLTNASAKAGLGEISLILARALDDVVEWADKHEEYHSPLPRPFA